MKNKVLSVNIFMFILFIVMLITLGIDYCTYLFNAEYIISLFISLIFNAFVVYFLMKKIQINTDIKKEDIIFFILLLGIFIITIVYPDRSFDTFNYHLYLQEHPFGDKIGFDFFAGKHLNSFTYALPDRMFYLFRYFLGYRLGVILNYLILITIYYQIKEIIKNLISKAKPITLVIFAILITTSLSFIDIIDSYYIDLISLVLLLEIFRLVMNQKINDKNNTYLIGYFALLFGFSFVVKISNAFMLILFFLVYIIKNRNIVKYINIKNILIAILMLFIPFIIYISYTYLETKNPVFPFYNTIFKSKYFANFDWLDTRFGPHNILGVLFYPFIILLYPGRSCDIAIAEPTWCYGYAVSIMYTIYYMYIKIIKKEQINNNRLTFFIVTILVYLIWAKFQLGYTRYGFITLALGGIATYIFIYDIVKNKKYLLIGIASVLMLYNFSYSSSNYMYRNQNWIYNNYFSNSASYKYNLKNLFSKGYENKIKFEEGSVWGIFYYNAGLAQMINNEIPIINMTDSANSEYAAKLFDEKVRNATHIYTLVDSLDLENFIENINRKNYKIIDVKDVLSSSIISREDSFTYIFEVQKRDNFKNSTDYFNGEKIIDVKDYKMLETLIGIEKYKNKRYSENITLTILGNKNNEQYEVIDQFDISYEGKLKHIKYDVSNYDNIKIISLDKNGKKNLDGWFMLINLELK